MSKFHALIGEDAYRNLLVEQVTTDTEWLDLGCGWRLLREWLPNGETDQLTLARRARRLVGIDGVLDDVSRNLYLHDKVVGSLLQLPFRDGAFDLVTAQMVVEHLEKPLPFLEEVKRVLSPGGKFVFLTPNYANYQVFAASLMPTWVKKPIVLYLEHRAESDVFKVYYRMNTAQRIENLARQSGFEVREIRTLHQAWEFRRVPPLHWIERGVFRMLDRKAISRYWPKILAILARSEHDR